MLGCIHVYYTSYTTYIVYYALYNDISYVLHVYSSAWKSRARRLHTACQVSTGCWIESSRAKAIVDEVLTTPICSRIKDIYIEKVKEYQVTYPHALLTKASDDAPVKKSGKGGKPPLMHVTRATHVHLPDTLDNSSDEEKEEGYFTRVGFTYSYYYSVKPAPPPAITWPARLDVERCRPIIVNSGPSTAPAPAATTHTTSTTSTTTAAPSSSSSSAVAVPVHTTTTTATPTITSIPATIAASDILSHQP